MLAALPALDPGVLPDFPDPAWVFSHAVPLILLIAAVLAGRAALPAPRAWQIARTATTLTLGLALATVAVRLADPATDGWPLAFSVVLALVTSIGVVITRFAGTYLEGEPRQQDFVRWLCLTLAGSSLVVATDHLGVAVGAWIGTSLALQDLLVFYRDRPQAQMAAHKKFLVSRSADLCMLAAAVLLALEHGTLQLAALNDAARAGSFGLLSQTAVVLLALGTLLKSAQLPFHGWLMQVMEAPTPVSALLHAGVVNLGGFVLVRLADAVLAVPAAQALLVVAGSLTAVLAGLVTSTRISIKVGLAWSTCAQMGFMVLQCGLGLFEMALLHLVAHSLYKAHAFLSSGETVHQALVARMAPHATSLGLTPRLVSGAAGLATVWAAGWLAGVDLLASPALAAMLVVVGASLAPLLFGGPSRGLWIRAPLAAAALAALWLGLHAALRAWLPSAAPSWGTFPAGPTVLAAWVALAFATLFVVRALVVSRPEAPRIRSLHDLFFGGLFLDEWFTRLTLRIWPVRRTPRRSFRLLLAPKGGSAR